MPVYAMWLLGLPNQDNRRRFEDQSECPYCFDDGTGEVGDVRSVDRASEVRRAWVLLLKTLVVIALAFSFLTLWIFSHTGRSSP
jgi:hypothetical protein